MNHILIPSSVALDTDLIEARYVLASPYSSAIDLQSYKSLKPLLVLNPVHSMFEKRGKSDC